MSERRPKDLDLLESVKNIIDDMMSEGDISPTYKVCILTDDQWDSNVSRTADQVIRRVKEELCLQTPSRSQVSASCASSAGSSERRC